MIGIMTNKWLYQKQKHKNTFPPSIKVDLLQTIYAWIYPPPPHQNMVWRLLLPPDTPDLWGRRPYTACRCCYPGIFQWCSVRWGSQPVPWSVGWKGPYWWGSKDWYGRWRQVEAGWGCGRCCWFILVIPMHPRKRLLPCFWQDRHYHQFVLLLFQHYIRSSLCFHWNRCLRRFDLLSSI